MIEKNWNDMIKPSNVVITAKGGDIKGTVVAEPIERGYGLTLGNSLRRVLLSSLRGAAVTAIKIENVLHEFSSISGVREDVVDIILNVKNIAVKSFVDGKTNVILEATGPCEVTAGMIQSNANVEIMNPDLVLCHLDKEATLNIDFTINIDMSLSQEGFTFDTNSEIKPSSVIVDLDNDGNNEIIFGDNNGMIRALNHNGIEIFNDFFPFDTGNQIWGSAASGYIDQDNLIDVAILSKSKHLYVFDNNGLKLDYNSNKFLIGTPALGNLDNDDDLEIVFGSFSSSAQLFAVNIDGSDVEGFPMDLGEKSQKGVALADFNNNGKDDIVIGTDSDNIFLIYDNGQVATGFPFLAQDKIRSAPVVLDLGDEKIIIAGSKDNNLYAINSDGSLRFLFQADDEIYTSPSFLNTEQGLHIFFGTDSGYLYSLDINGNLNDGFPINNIDYNYFDSIVGSIVFEDLDSDGFEEIIFGDELGKMYVLKTLDETYSDLYRYNSFPISNVFAYTSSPNVFDIDNDGDYEIYAGTSGDVVIIDIKEFYSVVNQENWNTYRGGFDRKGYYNYVLPCVSGDLNNDNIINILDIVTVVNIVIDNLDVSDAQQCSGDVNNDSIINILDIVTLVNWIIN